MLGKMLRSLRLKIAVVFSVLISMMFVILGTAVYQLQKEKEVRSLDEYSQNAMDLCNRATYDICSKNG